MSIFQNIFKPRSSNHLAGGGPRFFFGQSASGANVNERTAMSMTAVYGCVRVLAESIASLPLHVYKKSNDGNRAKELGLPGITNAVEDVITARDIFLAEEAKVHLHLCHCSTKGSVKLVQMAKELGIRVTGEVCPHHFILTDEDITEDHSKFKMNPPLRGKADVIALKEALRDNIMDVISTDHAPHSEEEKSKGFTGSAFGIIGMETAFPVMYNELVDKDIISLEKLVEMLYEGPRKRFGLDVCTLEEELAKERPTFALWDLDAEYKIDPDKFLSMGRSTPFDGWDVKGRCLMTVVGGEIIQEYKDERHQIHDNK